MATEWPTASCHGTVTGVDAGCQFLLVVFSNGGTLRGILNTPSSKSTAAAAAAAAAAASASAGGPKNLGFVAKGMDCCMFLGKAKAAVATRKTYNAVVFFVHIGVGNWKRVEPGVQLKQCLCLCLCLLLARDSRT